MILELDVDIGSIWPIADWRGRCQASAEAAIAELIAGGARPYNMVSIALRLTDDAELHRLNLQFRHKDQPTDILSFPAGPHAPPGGDIAVALETTAAAAAKRGISLEQHTQHLIVHGVLHLLGHDHADDARADAMEALERAALARLGLPDPYR